MSKRFHIKSYGCQMNVYDSERMTELLVDAGYEAVDDADKADLILLNTCHIREKAAEKVYSDIGRFKALARRRDGQDAPVIGVAGCVAQAEGEEILNRAPAVDLVVGPQAYHRLPALLARTQRGRGTVETDFPADSKFDHLPRRTRAAPSAFLTVQEGCDKFCTFCVVPYTRGAEASRPVADIVAEARDLVDRGAKEITLLGQNVNAYHGANAESTTATLAELCYALAEIKGLARLRYTTSHPRDMSDDLIEAHAALPILMPYLHLPIQSGSDKILKAMNRRHDRAFYLDIIERLRAARPDIALSSDIIVGFPGETEADFEATMALVEQVRYAQCYSFKYSPRPGTPGAEMEEQLPEPVKAERLARLQALLGRQQAAFNAASVGRVFDILVERRGRHARQYVGRSPYMQAVHFESEVDADGDQGYPVSIGDMVRVRIVAAGPHSLTGEPVADDRNIAA